MSRTAKPTDISRTATKSASIPATVTKANVATIEIIGSLNQNTGGEEAESVLVINPK